MRLPLPRCPTSSRHLSPSRWAIVFRRLPLDTARAGQSLDGAASLGTIWLVPLPLLTTARLTLRPVTEDDLSMMVDLNSDPAVMAHILGRPASPAETAAEWSARLSQRTDVARGLGYWAGYHAEQFVGWWGASAFVDRLDISSIGYRLHRAALGTGPGNRRSARDGDPRTLSARRHSSRR